MKRNKTARVLEVTVILVSLSFVLLGCDSSDEDLGVCKPGATEPCSCPGGQQGVRLCNAAGDGWQDCQCSVVGDDGGTFSDGPASLPDGPAVLPDGSAVQPDGPAVQPDGPVAQPDGPAVQPDGPVAQPDSAVAGDSSTQLNCGEIGDCSDVCAAACSNIGCMMNCPTTCKAQGCPSAIPLFDTLYSCIQSKCLFSCISGPTPACKNCTNTNCAAEVAACDAHTC